MIRFEKNGNTVTVVEDAAEFKATLNNSIDAAAKLAAGNPYQAIELYTRFNSPGEFAILISEESFNRIKFGYGYDQNGKSMMIAPILLSNNTVKFLAFIPTDRYPNAGHIIPITVEDGDILSKEPLEDKGEFSDEDVQILGSFARILNSDDPDKTYRSELFKLANLLCKNGYSRKEAFRLAKERLNNFCPDNEPKSNPRIFEKKPEVKDNMHTDALRDELTQDFKRCAQLITDINEIEASIKAKLNQLCASRPQRPKSEKRVDPTPPSMKPGNVLLNTFIQAFEEVFGVPLF